MVKNSILLPMYANFYFNMLVFVGVLEYCTLNGNKLFLYGSKPSERKAVAMQGKMIYMLHDFCKATSYCMCYITSKQADFGSVTCMCCVLCSTLTLNYNCVPISYTVKFKTVLPHSVVRINGLNILAGSLFSFHTVTWPKRFRSSPDETVLREKTLTHCML
ncbi:hypothetical protein PAMP_012134 [Pampus punctatissimus]